jgi:AraC family transcriptional regulator, regulatory protein of adaptative response / methylated-DNA-[protein]-cysteine methyltransferase
MANLNASPWRENWSPGGTGMTTVKVASMGGEVRYGRGGSGELIANGASYGVNGAGARVAFTVVDSQFGRILIATTRVGVCWIGVSDNEAHLTVELQRDLSDAEVSRDDDGLSALARTAVDFIHGDAREIVLPIDLRGTPFQISVWRELCTIPWGATRSYGEIARRLGRPEASRAVGAANGSNPLAIIIPCHRAIGADGSLTGYRWGLEYKRRLLDHECALAQAPLAFG